ncbi:MAG: NADH-quinone oxidoreductase subunit K [Pseudomonadota bacterium]
MTGAVVYALAGVTIYVIGLHALIVRVHLLRKIIALNVMGSGVFLVLGALARRTPGAVPDAVPHALVITGIVVAVASTALAIVMMLRVHAVTGRAELPRSDRG